MSALQSFANVFNVPDLRKRVVFTFLLLAVYRLGSHIPTPGVDPAAIDAFFRSSAGSLFGFLDIFSGGALRRLSVFALGIMPYISASIILQLLTVVWPYLEKLSKEGEMGRKKITQYTRYGTVLLSFIQASGIALWLEKQVAPTGARLVPHAGWGFRLMTILTLTTGTIFIMWLGEQITERGIGNGISLIIFAGIVVALPRAIFGLFQQIRGGTLNILTLIGVLAFMVGIIALIVFVERAQRRIPVQYAKRVVGRRIYGGQNTYLPLRVNTGGVIPIIFAISIIQLPSYIATLVGADWTKKVANSLGQGQPLYVVLYALGILFFCYFYTSIVFNPTDTADNMRKYGGFIPGIRPGKKTADYIDTVLSRLTIIGALYLTFVALLPDFLSRGFRFASLPWFGARLEALLPRFFSEGFGFNFYFGGTSLLIVVGVAMDTVQQVESKLVEHHYTGFLKKSRIRGRRS
ncbi:MAG TPA: preprotein translocase subunit SecY [Thermoanaerobaculia bacterium]|nr:preprotein translocase subunit SecY [Thermoanaerobaculia bacterium]